MDIFDFVNKKAEKGLNLKYIELLRLELFLYKIGKKLPYFLCHEETGDLVWVIV